MSSSLGPTGKVTSYILAPERTACLPSQVFTCSQVPPVCFTTSTTGVCRRTPAKCETSSGDAEPAVTTMTLEFFGTGQWPLDRIVCPPPLPAWRLWASRASCLASGRSLTCSSACGASRPSTLMLEVFRSGFTNIFAALRGVCVTIFPLLAMRAAHESSESSTGNSWYAMSLAGATNSHSGSAERTGQSLLFSCGTWTSEALGAMFGTNAWDLLTLRRP
mmetsp:Transcript_46302/g.86468  ORF Transcript_46302/g.86468 Transcript_46302/m.86468 type:complete len:219 (+) Transcript_46302:562-1218(+)